jgi:hypothetical protein
LKIVVQPSLLPRFFSVLFGTPRCTIAYLQTHTVKDTLGRLGFPSADARPAAFAALEARRIHSRHGTRSPEAQGDLYIARALPITTASYPRACAMPDRQVTTLKHTERERIVVDRSDGPYTKIGTQAVVLLNWRRERPVACWARSIGRMCGKRSAPVSVARGSGAQGGALIGGIESHRPIRALDLRF